MGTRFEELDGKLVATLEGELDTAAAVEAEEILKPLYNSEGKDVMFLAVGAMLDECIAAAEKLRESGIDAGVINTAVVKPLDSTWADLDTRLVVTVEDNVISGGFGESFDSAFKDAGFSILNIAIPDKFIEHGEHGDIPSLRRECGIDAESIYERTLRYFTGE